MDQNGRPAFQVVINGNDQMAPYGSHMQYQNQPRPLSVDEALQYSSMSSAPVFGLGWFTRFVFSSAHVTDNTYIQTASYAPMLADPRTLLP
jgi:hypothetical protein